MRRILDQIASSAIVRRDEVAVTQLSPCTLRATWSWSPTLSVTGLAKKIRNVRRPLSSLLTVTRWMSGRSAFATEGAASAQTVASATRSTRRRDGRARSTKVMSRRWRCPFKNRSKLTSARLGASRSHLRATDKLDGRVGRSYDEPYVQPYDRDMGSPDMPRIVTADDLRARLGRELDALRDSEEALYVSKRGRLAGVLLDPDRYAELLDRLEYLEDSIAALQAREERELAVPWAEVRE